NVLMCHVFADPGLDRGQEVFVGDRLGTVAPDGQAENNGIAHIHLQVNRRDGSRGSSGEPVPLAGEFALDGVSFSATSEYNGHYLRRVTSTNDASANLPRVNAGADRLVNGGASVTLAASGENVADYAWAQ